MIIIYVLLHPVTGSPFYVGQSSNFTKRYYTHCSSPRTKTGIELKNSNQKPSINILESPTAETALEREKFWIAKLRADGCQIENQTVGGAREGAGRKETGRNTVTIGLSVPIGHEDEIRKLVKDRIAVIRGVAAPVAPEKKPVVKSASKKVVPEIAPKQGKKPIVSPSQPNLQYLRTRQGLKNKQH